MALPANEKVIVELKSVEVLARVHREHFLTDLRGSELKLGLLINFGGGLPKDNIKRLVNSLDQESAEMRSAPRPPGTQSQSSSEKTFAS